MPGGKHHSTGRVIFETRKGSLLSADERAKVRELVSRGWRSPAAIARAIGRSVPDVANYLNSPEAEHG